MVAGMPLGNVSQRFVPEIAGKKYFAYGKMTVVLGETFVTIVVAQTMCLLLGGQKQLGIGHSLCCCCMMLHRPTSQAANWFFIISYHQNIDPISCVLKLLNPDMLNPFETNVCRAGAESAPAKGMAEDLGAETHEDLLSDRLPVPP